MVKHPAQEEGLKFGILWELMVEEMGEDRLEDGELQGNGVG